MLTTANSQNCDYQTLELRGPPVMSKLFDPFASLKFLKVFLKKIGTKCFHLLWGILLTTDKNVDTITSNVVTTRPKENLICVVD